MIFADPPYFLSDGGFTVHGVCVNKGDWDHPLNSEEHTKFTHDWLSASRKILKPSGTIWISGTIHNIFLIVNQLLELDFKILNIITWQKTNPPPNFSCRTFVHSTEFVIWARKEKKIPHFYAYDIMRKINHHVQMRDVWSFPSVASWEKKYGRHPTQKPLSLLCRIILASTQEGEIILDPFCGSSTTGIAANLLNRRFIGIDQNESYLNLSIQRYKGLQNPRELELFRRNLQDFHFLELPNPEIENSHQSGRQLRLF